jgi:hypothetical protein
VNVSNLFTIFNNQILGSREVTTEEPIPTESYPSSTDEVPDVDIPEIDYENWPYAMMECKLQQKLTSSFFSNNQNIRCTLYVVQDIFCIRKLLTQWSTREHKSRFS